MDVPVSKAPNRSAARADPDRGVTPKQRDGDANEADVRHLHVEHPEPELPAEDVDAAGEACEAAGDRHREDEVARDADAPVTRRLGIEPDGPHLVSECRPVEDEVEGDEGSDCDEDADV